MARLAGLTVRTLRHYDEIGLLVPSARSGAGYRLYDDGDVRRLYRILALRAAGLPARRDRGHARGRGGGPAARGARAPRAARRRARAGRAAPGAARAHPRRARPCGRAVGRPVHRSDRGDDEDGDVLHAGAARAAAGARRRARRGRAAAGRAGLGGADRGGRGRARRRHGPGRPAARSARGTLDVAHRGLHGRRPWDQGLPAAALRRRGGRAGLRAARCRPRRWPTRARRSRRGATSAAPTTRSSAPRGRRRRRRRGRRP